jgi:hypothetical protein
MRVYRFVAIKVEMILNASVLAISKRRYESG